MRQALGQADAGEHVFGALNGRVVLHSGEDQGHGHVVDGVVGGDQVERLEHVADVVAAEVGQLAARELGQVVPDDLDAALARLVERADHVEQRALAGAGRAHDGEVLAAEDVQVHVAQGVDRGLAELVDLAQVPDPDQDFLCHSASSGRG